MLCFHESPSLRYARRPMRVSDVATWDRFWRARARPDDFGAASPRLVERLATHLTPGCRVLEIGPGTGRDALALAARGAHVVALDSSAEALALIERGLAVPRAAPLAGSLCLLQGDGLHTPFADGRFDLVYHQGLLEHFRDPMPLLLENRRLLRPGGMLLVDVPQTFHAWTLIKKTLIAADRWFAGWETQYTPGQLQALVTSAGFDVLDVFGDWMHPSLAYRCVRAGMGRLGVRLPQRPPLPRAMETAADRLTRAVMATRAGRLTALTVAVVARKRGD